MSKFKFLLEKIANNDVEKHTVVINSNDKTNAKSIVKKMFSDYDIISIESYEINR